MQNSQYGKSPKKRDSQGLTEKDSFASWPSASGKDHIGQGADGDIAPALRYFHEKYHFPAVQVVQTLKRERVDDKIQVVNGEHFTSSLSL
ncbi:MAG: hypothetical protein HY069_02895 [Chlamydiia bacterium]|nr:hypothetical protein [Chlamydiia bacterium]